MTFVRKERKILPDLDFEKYRYFVFRIHGLFLIYFHNVVSCQSKPGAHEICQNAT